MAGKSYTYLEMKNIVNYLVQNKLYGEVKGRKMWIDFANSQLTMRTWQSLKETFLKRILPDIHNPYYNLNIEQINSFRVGYDVVDRNKSKLEVQTISDDSNSNGPTLKDNEHPNNGNSEEGETTAGESNKCSKIPPRSRSSADTVILDNCYETAEEIQKDLESNGDKETDEKPIAKSFRDCITYSEPLTPMLQEVLDDFASEAEDSDRENLMEIVENVPENDNFEDTNQIPEPKKEIPSTKSVVTDVAKNAKGLSAEVVEEVLAHELDGGNKNEKKSPKKQIQNATVETEKVPNINLDEEASSTQAENSTEKNDDAQAETVGSIKFVTAENTENSVAIDSENTDVPVPNDSQSEPQVQSGGLNNSNSTVDASLPNNPEAFKNKHSKNDEDKNKEVPEKAVEVSNTPDKSPKSIKFTRKRSFSVDTLNTTGNKKKKLELKLLRKKDKTPTIESHMNEKEIINENVDLKTVDDKPKANKESNNSEMNKKTVQVVVAAEDNPNKPSTSFDDGMKDNSDIKEINNKNESAEIKNPCLQNISLFDEQFNKTNYNMSESSDTEQNKKETDVNKQDVTVPKDSDDVVMLNSHTESDTEEVHSVPKKKKNRVGVLSSKSERDKAIANMFGFTSGGVGSKRRRELSRRRRTVSHNNSAQQQAAAASHSSEWASESDSDNFVSPPQSRRNRSTKKYLRPKAGRILSLEEEGGLFVMYGNQIFPVVKNGKILKNYVTYLPESDSEQEESYWKQKYEKEKKKSEDLKNLLELRKEPELTNSNTVLPIPQANPERNSRSSHQPAGENSNDVGKEISIPVPHEKKEETKVNPPEKIKIKFTKNNEEVHLEGHWPQIHPVLEQVVQIFHKEVEPTVSETKSKMILEQPEHSKEPSSGISTPVIITPVDPEVHEKVNKIEKEIFMEIEELDKEEENGPIVQETNVTLRKVGRPRKASSSISTSPMKTRKTSIESDTKTKLNTSSSKLNTTATENKDVPSKRLSRTPRKVLNETANINDSNTVQTRRTKQKLEDSKPSKANDDEEIKYMFPPKNKRLKSPANNKRKPQKSSAKTEKIFSSPDNFSLNSMDSTQGYQDSDVSPVKTELRKKKKLDMPSFIMKTRNSLRRSTRRRPHPYLYCDAYNDSSNTSVDELVESVPRENSSLNSTVYRSQSYQLLMPRTRNSLTQLEPIDETSPIGNKTYNMKHLDSMHKNEISVQINNNFTSNSGLITSDVGSSSNVSLPISPELSLVENMSVSKEMLQSIEDYPTLNEMQSNEIKEPSLCTKYIISDVDVSVALMQQDCGLERCNTLTSDATDPKDLVTESLLSKVGTFNINDQVTVTDSLDQKLHDLLLESAKKMTKTQNAHNQESMMDVDITNVEVPKKTKSKKRCSTPRKRKVTKKSVAPKVDPVVEEEHVQSCSHSGRKSCPPIFQTYVCDENIVNEVINITNLAVANEKPKARKKKDIIRVKILRPKNKKAQEKLHTESAQNASKISVFTDSGINNTESEVFPFIDDSVDLIHNHSETCLHASDCVCDSVEFVENSKSVITLGDSMQSGDNLWNSQSENNDANHPSADVFSNNAQDVSFYKKNSSGSNENTSDTVYHSPLGTEMSHNSLITEDLSDDDPQPATPPARTSMWYLLSEDDTNTNTAGKASTSNGGSFGSNLKQLFPIACAVPNLSTVTEMSRETNDSRKHTLNIDGLTGDDFDSKSIFE